MADKASNHGQIRPSGRRDSKLNHLLVSSDSIQKPINCSMVNPTQRRKVKNPTHKGRKFRTPRKPTVPNLPGLKEKWNMKISVKSNYEKLGLMRHCK
ncbi:hypothetical protein DSO57_1026233 [Entomophthora muscae]|uniref:Uncharacterized protein n=1 Tax=Entomophthora muscae TaxID=34485 RepID=A0ACC2SR57_9FUNG|nr:hypothetical protein DSO57_1026233 [Entomophthora muscae]